MGRFKSPGTVRREQRQQELSDISTRRLRRVLIYGAVGIASVLLLLPVFKKVGHEGARWYEQRQVAHLQQGTITYDNARRHPELRQRFLDQLIGTNTIPFCTGVVYDHDGRNIRTFIQTLFDTHPSEKNKFAGMTQHELDNGMYDVKTPDNHMTAGKGESIPIFVGRAIFESPSYSYLIAGDVLHILTAHEAHHCKQHAKGLPYITPGELVKNLEARTIRLLTVHYVLEYDAFQHDLPRLIAGEFKVSAQYAYERKRLFIQTRHALTQAMRTASPLEQKLIGDVQVATEKIPSLRDLTLSPAP